MGLQLLRKAQTNRPCSGAENDPARPQTKGKAPNSPRVKGVMSSGAPGSRGRGLLRAIVSSRTRHLGRAGAARVQLSLYCRVLRLVLLGWRYQPVDGVYGCGSAGSRTERGWTDRGRRVWTHHVQSVERVAVPPRQVQGSSITCDVWCLRRG